MTHLTGLTCKETSTGLASLCSLKLVVCSQRTALGNSPIAGRPNHKFLVMSLTSREQQCEYRIHQVVQVWV